MTLECECFERTKQAYGVILYRFTLDNDSSLFEITSSHGDLFEKGKKYTLTIEEK